MDLTPFQIWICAALALAAAEMATGTFYLLALAAASLLPSALAYGGAGFTAQAISFAIASAACLILAHKFRNAAVAARDDSGTDQDIGRFAEVDEVLHNGALRIRHRGTLWDARALSGTCEKGQTVMIAKKEANLFWVIPQPAGGASENA